MSTWWRTTLKKLNAWKSTVHQLNLGFQFLKGFSMNILVTYDSCIQSFSVAPVLIFECGHDSTRNPQKCKQSVVRKFLKTKNTKWVCLHPWRHMFMSCDLQTGASYQGRGWWRWERRPWTWWREPTGTRMHTASPRYQRPSWTCCPDLRKLLRSPSQSTWKKRH